MARLTLRTFIAGTSVNAWLVVLAVGCTESKNDSGLSNGANGASGSAGSSPTVVATAGAGESASTSSGDIAGAATVGSGGHSAVSSNRVAGAPGVGSGGAQSSIGGASAVIPGGSDNRGALPPGGAAGRASVATGGAVSIGKGGASQSVGVGGQGLSSAGKGGAAVGGQTGGASKGGAANSGTAASGASAKGGSSGTATTSFTPITMADNLPPAGTTKSVDVPASALPEDVSAPTTVIGDGTKASCTSKAFVDAVWKGGTITFNCGADPYTLELDATAEVNNKGAKKTVIDGGGRVTLSGKGQRRILYQNVCLERLGWATSDCWGQDFPRLVLQNLTFINGYTDDDEGGGAVHVAGGRLKVVNSRFFHNTATKPGPDVGGGALRVEQIQAEPVYIVQTTFGGDGTLGNAAANGGGLSGLFANFFIYNSTFVNNSTTSCCGNPTTSGDGGGSGGAIYMDGMKLQLELHNVELANNSCQAHGSAIFFVSNDHAGVLTIADSQFRNNAEGEGNWYPEKDISMHEDTKRTITNTTFQ